MEPTRYIVHYQPIRMNQDQYEAILHRLMQAQPEACDWHICIGSGDGLEVIDLWDSLDRLKRFQAILFPILRSVGVICQKPTPMPVVNAFSPANLVAA